MVRKQARLDADRATGQTLQNKADNQRKVTREQGGNAGVRTSPFSRGWRLRSSTQTSDSFTRSPIGGDLGRYKKKSARAGACQSSAIKPEVRAKSLVVNQSPPREIKPAQAVPVARLEAMASRRRTCFF